MGNKSWIYLNQWMSGALFSSRKAHVLLWPPCRGRRAPSDGIDETGAPLKIYLFAKRNRPFIDHLWTMVMFRRYIKISKGDNHPRVPTTLETLSLKQLSYSKLWRRDPIFSCVSASICGWAQSGFCLVLIHPIPLFAAQKYEPQKWGSQSSGRFCDTKRQIHQIFPGVPSML